MNLFVTYLIGLTFGVGISISGMVNPAKVLNFFDIAGTWDPSLAVVMVSALAVATVGYRIAFRRPRPIYSQNFHVPTSRVIDRKLVLGSATFGIGWGIAGFCPGGAIPALGTGTVEVFVFFLAMCAGIVLAKMWIQFTGPPPQIVRAESKRT